MNKNDLEIVQKMIDVQVSQALEMLLLGETILNTGGDTQTWQIKTARGEIIENAKHLEQYGITTLAPSGSETLALRVRGNRTNTVLLNIGNRELRFKELEAGEVCIYDNSGNIIHLKNGGNMELNAPNSVLVKTKSATVEATTVNVKATTSEVEATDINLLGNVNLGGIGGAKLARIGDSVQVDPVTHQGTITSGCTKAGAI